VSERLTLELEPVDNERLANLCGQFDDHLKQIEGRLAVEIFCRGNLFNIQGEEHAAKATRRLLQNLYKLTEHEVLTPELLNLHLQGRGTNQTRHHPRARPESKTIHA
jgi:phosphate starvation-inducible PhoH-like protein